VLEGDGDRSVLAIRAGRSRFTLQTLPKATFRSCRRRDDHTFALAASDVKRLIDRTQFAISTEETRYYLNASICTRPAAPRPPRCARSQPTASAGAGRYALPRGADGMPGVIVRARRWAKCSA